MRKAVFLVLSLIYFINFGFSTFSSTSDSEFTLNLIHCSNYDVTYLNSYLDKNTIVNYIVSNNSNKLDVEFAFPIYGFLYVKTNKRLYKIKINGSKTVLISLGDNETINSISYTWYNLDCDYVKQLMLLNKNQNECQFDETKYNKLKNELQKLKEKIKKIKGDIFYKKEYNKIINYYNRVLENLNDAELSYLANNCIKFNQDIKNAEKYIDLLNKELNKNFIDILFSLIFG